MHTCAPFGHPEKVAVLKARVQMLLQADSSEDRTQSIIGANTQALSDNVKAYLPSIAAMKRGIRRVRAGNNLPAPEPNNLGFEIPQEWSVLVNGEQFLLYDNNNAEARMLIYGTNAQISFLAMADDWYMDGTFSVAPPQFAQLYTVHGLRNEHHVIGCYGLLPNKQQVTYTEFLRQVQRLTQGAAPTTIMIDYEIACINAIPTVYPHAIVIGCLFHLCKSVYRHVQGAALQQQYMIDEEFRANIRMIPALAFVPLADVHAAFEALSEHCDGNEDRILDYFEVNYIGELRRGRRRNPLFAHSLWNISNRVENDLPRTNNALEGWHNQFNRCFAAAHPNI